MADGQPLAGRSSWAGVLRVGGIEHAVDVAVGASGLACAASTQGELYCWGDPRLYAEQVVTAPSSRQIGRVSAATDVAEIALSTERGQSLVRKRDGSVWHWRWDDPGARYGVGASSDLERFEGLDRADAVVLTKRAGCVRRGTEAHCWGLLTDAAGASVDLGLDEAPRRIEALPAAARLSLSEQELCVATASGAVHCLRVESEALVAREIAELKNVVALAAGARHSCALSKGGEVHCWGDNRLGQLGGGKPDAAGPVRVVGLAAASCIAAHENRSCACVADGEPHCWGGAPGRTAAPAF
jgi:alpha-tubulin suppressor-like RCC1 family protein